MVYTRSVSEGVHFYHEPRRWATGAMGYQAREVFGLYYYSSLRFGALISFSSGSRQLKYIQLCT